VIVAERFGERQQYGVDAAHAVRQDGDEKAPRATSTIEAVRGAPNKRQ
jgi:hypothetical protein